MSTYIPIFRPKWRDIKIQENSFIHPRLSYNTEKTIIYVILQLTSHYGTHNLCLVFIFAYYNVIHLKINIKRNLLSWLEDLHIREYSSMIFKNIPYCKVAIHCESNITWKHAVLIRWRTEEYVYKRKNKLIDKKRVIATMCRVKIYASRCLRKHIHTYIIYDKTLLIRRTSSCGQTYVEIRTMYVRNHNGAISGHVV